MLNRINNHQAFRKDWENAKQFFLRHFNQLFYFKLTNLARLVFIGVAFVHFWMVQNTIAIPNVLSHFHIMTSVYSLLVLVSFVAIWRNHLLVVNVYFLLAHVFVDTMIFSGWIFLSGHVANELPLFLLLPALMLTRLPKNQHYSLVYVVSIAISFPALFYLINKRMSLTLVSGAPTEFQGPLLLLEWAFRLGVVFLFVFSTWRNYKRTEMEAVRADLGFMLEHVCKQVNAFLCITRVRGAGLTNFMSYLQHASPNYNENVAENRLIFLNNGDSELIESTIESGETFYQDDELLQSTQFTHLIHDNARTGHSFALRMPEHTNNLVTFSVYYSELIDQAESNKQLQPHLKRIHTYLRHKSDVLHKLEQQARPVANSAYRIRILNDATSGIIGDTDSAGTQNKIVKAALDISGWPMGMLFRYDSTTQQYRNDGRSGYGGFEPQGVPIRLPADLIKQHINHVDVTERLGEEVVFPTAVTKIHAYRLTTNVEPDDVGLLLIATNEAAQLDLPLSVHQLLVTLARNGAFDLKNISAGAQREKGFRTIERVAAMQRGLFDDDTPISFEEFAKQIVTVFDEELESSFCNLLFLTKDHQRNSDFPVTCSDPAIELADSTITIDNLDDIFAAESGITTVDYSVTKASRFVNHYGVKFCYIVRLDLDDLDMEGAHTALLYVNYTEGHKASEHDRHVLPVMLQQATNALKGWFAFETILKNKNRALREQWRFDLHDKLNELQYAVMLPLNKLARQHSDQQTALVVELTKIHKQLQSVNRSMKYLMDDMDHPELVNNGLDAAIHRIRETHQSGDRLEISIDGDIEPNSDVANVMYRIAREAVQNAFKHGEKNTQVRLDLRLLEDEAELVVQDNGPGIPHGEPHAGLGIQLMRYQAKLIGAETRFESSLGGCGTRVSCRWRKGTIQHG